MQKILVGKTGLRAQNHLIAINTAILLSMYKSFKL